MLEYMSGHDTLRRSKRETDIFLRKPCVQISWLLKNFLILASALFTLLFFFLFSFLALLIKMMNVHTLLSASYRGLNKRLLGLLSLCETLFSLCSYIIFFIFHKRGYVLLRSSFDTKNVYVKAIFHDCLFPCLCEIFVLVSVYLRVHVA